MALGRRNRIAQHEEKHHVSLELKLNEVIQNQSKHTLKLNKIIQNQNKIMATNKENFDLLMGRLDVITTNIAEDYQTLLDAIKNGTEGQVTAEQIATHEANIAKLEVIGASVENPVPPPPPVDPNA